MDRRKFTKLLMSAAALLARRGWAEESPDQDIEMSFEDTSGSRVYVPMPTLGGKQFWGDELFFHGWHIQRNVLTGHYRLLDVHNVRRAWGSFEECRAELNEIRRREKLPPMQGRGVVVLHGLGRNAASMGKLASRLRTDSDFTIFNVVYPTTRGSIADHARQIAHVVDSLEGLSEINFVTHSLGGLVVRHYLADQTDAATGRAPDPRIKRIVMIAPPNQGARLAEVFGRYKAFDMVLGKAAGDIRDYRQMETRFAIPACEFAIIAGGRGITQGYNPWLEGDNDLVVSVESTRLPGARDFVLLPAIHTLIMDDPKVQQYTLRFLHEGHLVAADQRQPITHDNIARAEKPPVDGPAGSTSR